MASRFNRFSNLTRQLFGKTAPARIDPSKGAVGKQFVELETRAVPATFVVTNILDNQTDVVGGLSLRQAINAANSNPGFDRIEFNIPRSPSLPTIPNDTTESYFPIVLASTLPDLTDPAGTSIDATTQPRNNATGTRPIVQLLPDPNPGAFPGQKGAFFISGSNNTIRGLVITGFPGAAMNFAGTGSHDNVVVGNWINTDITGTKPWSEDPIISSARPPGTRPELTNTGPLADGTVGGNINPLFVLGGITLTNGAHDNIIGGVIDEQAAPLADSGGRLIGTGGTISRYNSKGVLVDTGIAVTPALGRNIISGTPQFKKSYFNYTWALDGSTKVRQDDIAGAAVGPGIRIQDPGTDRNLIQGNFIGTGITGNEAIPNHNGIEIFNNATSNMIGNPTTQFTGDPVAAGVGNLIRFNENDGVRMGDTPNPSQIAPPPPPVPGPPQPYQEGEDFFTTTGPGPFGPTSQSGRLGSVFFDSYNPNYLHGVSPTNKNILSVLRTTLDFTDANKTINTAVTPTTGVAAQVGATITLRGSGLLATTAVTFNSSAVSTAQPQTVPAKFTVINDTEIRVIVPAGALTPPPRVAPNADIPAINVFTPAGVARIQDAVIYPAPPAQIEVVETFSPSSGLPGTKVSIFGSGFVGASTVSFGGVLATSFTVLPGGNQIDVIVPTGALSGPINIITPGGAASTSTRSFTVQTQPAPFINAVNKASALPGQEVILTGTNFTGAYIIRFNHSGGVSGFTTTNFTVDSPTQIRVKVPTLATASNGPIQVVTNDGFGVSTVTLQITAPPVPTIATLSQTSGPIGTQVTIVGTGFTSATRVTFSGLDAQKFTIVNSGTIVATVPFGIPVGTVSPVQVFSSTGGSTTLATFTTTASQPPTVDAIPFGNRNTFTVVNGTNLFGTTKVLFGDPINGTPATSFEVLSDTQLRVQLPVSLATNGNFYVYTAYNTQNPLQPPAQNTYFVNNTVTPVINTGRLSDPISGIIGQTVTLRGTGFLGTQHVYFPKAGGGIIAATNLEIVSDRELRFRVPQLAASGNITVDTLGVPDTLQPFDPAVPATAQTPLPTQTTTDLTPTTVGFTLLASPAPVIDGFFPASGPVGTFMTVSGRNLAGLAQITVGGAVVENPIIESDNVIKFRVPQLAANGPVQVVTPGGSASSADTYTVTASPLPTIEYSSPRVPRGAQVTIAGTGLAGTSKVLFNDVPAQFTIVSNTLITAIVPLTAGPGEIRVFTPGGNVASPTPFTLASLALPVLSVVNGRQRDETEDSAPVGAKITINTAANNVFRVEFVSPLAGAGAGTPANFTYGGGGLIVEVPELAPGPYELQVFASTNVGDGNYNGDANSYWDSSYTEATNILGDTFIYGETIQVLANARPRVDSVTTQDTVAGANIPFYRGAPIAIRGNGLTGANRVVFTSGTDPYDTTAATFVQIAATAGLAPDSSVIPNFTVVSDNLITMNMPITQFAGDAAVNNLHVFVFTPNGAVGDTTDDLASYQIDTVTGARVFNQSVVANDRAIISIPATPAFTFTLADNGGTLNGSGIGGTTTLLSTTGNFYSVNSLSTSGKRQVFDATSGKITAGAQFFAGNLPQPFPISGPTLNKLASPIQNFQIVPGTGGTQVVIANPGFTGTIPDTLVTNTGMNPLPTPPKAGLFDITAVFNSKTAVIAADPAANPTTSFVQSEPPTSAKINSITSDVGGATDVFNRTYTITGDIGLLAAASIVIGLNTGGSVTLNRNQFEVANNGGTVTLQFKNPTVRSPLDPHLTTAYPSGDYIVRTYGGQNVTITKTPSAQSFPAIFAFATPDDPPVDNRIIANRIFDNGLTINRDANQFFQSVTLKPQAARFTDGNLGVDFITQGNPGGTFPFAWGYAHTQQGAQTSPFPAGNQGRGGLNDGKLADSFIQAFPNNTFNNTQGGRTLGPNYLQNFPLLQVISSSLDRTEFSTALLGKPFRSYRIDYYYNPGIDNSSTDAELDPFLAGQGNLGAAGTPLRFDDQDATARSTTNIGAGQIYLGSKVITTDAVGDGRVSFNIYKKLPLDPNNPNSIPAAQPGEFVLPDNLPLQPSTINPNDGTITFRAGVVTSTATDLTAPGPNGPIVSSGPDGTSRFSFFKRVDTPTGSISGSVIIDKNFNNKIDVGEQGLDKAVVNLFVQRDDGTYSASPTATSIITADGSYFFGNTGFGTDRYGLPLGKHKLTLTLPTGGATTFFYETPADGKQSVTIISGEAVQNVNFLVTTSPTSTNTAPTISNIPNQLTIPGNTVTIPFTIGDAETLPANLVVSATSSNGAVIDASVITFGGSGADRTITLPTTTTPGNTTITVTVTDEGGLTAFDTFIVSNGVPPQNTPPQITDIADTTQAAGSIYTATFTVADAETSPGALIVSVASSNTGVIPAANVSISGTGATRTVTVQVPPGVTGASTITVTVTDDGGLMASDSFVVTVPPPVGTAPRLVAIGSDAGRMTQVKVYNPDGTFRYTLTPYGESFTGGARVSSGDVNGDGNADIIVAPGPGIPGLVKIYSGVTGEFITQLSPYGEFKGGTYVVSGDVDGDGIFDIITGTGAGGGPRVRVFRGGTNGTGGLDLQSLADFFPYENNFRGGVLVAAGDVNGDGKADIITGTGVKGGPRVRVLDATLLNTENGENRGAATIYDFFAYGSDFRGGVFASIGDVDGDNSPEIITGTGVGGGPVVKVFKQSTLAAAAKAGNGQPLADKSFFAYDPAFRGGVRVDTTDANGDGITDIITAPGRGIAGEVRVLNYATLQDFYRITAFESEFTGGVFIGGNVE